MTSDEAERLVPFYGITLVTIERPTIEQLRIVKALALHTGTNNYLELRDLLRLGGFQCFGEMLGERAAELSSKLNGVGVPHRIDQTGVWRMRRFDPEDPQSHVVFERPGAMIMLAASEEPK